VTKISLGMINKLILVYIVGTYFYFDNKSTFIRL